MHPFFKIITSLLTTLLLTSTLYAAVIYKWVDSEGRTHFTDNLANIPLKQNNYEKRSIEDSTSAKKDKQAIVADVAFGKEVWQSSCSSCHFVGADLGNNHLRKLPGKFLNPETSLENMVKNLTSSLELRARDMDNIKLSDIEIQAVGKYILYTITPK